MSRVREATPIAIERTDYNVIDTEFGSMRDQFDNEMTRVEEEMSRLKREFECYTPKMYHHTSTNGGASNGGGRLAPSIFQRPAAFNDDPPHAVSSALNNRYSNGPGIGGGGYDDRRRQQANGVSPSQQQQQHKPRYDPYLDNLKSPLIKDESDGKTLRLRFNVSQYLPEEVTVKTVENRLLVHAKHEEKTPQKSVYREYNQEFMMPRGTDPETITSSLSVDGILTVMAPLPSIEAPTIRSIQHR